jgi:hypothetical protein
MKLTMEAARWKAVWRMTRPTQSVISTSCESWEEVDALARLGRFGPLVISCAGTGVRA